MVLRVQPNRDWDDLDFKLMEAYQVLDDETCPKCGHPTWLCRSTSQDIEWTARDSICYATKRMEEKQDTDRPKGNKASKEERAKWGRIDFAIPRVPKNRAELGNELPSRTDYFESLAE